MNRLKVISNTDKNTDFWDELFLWLQKDFIKVNELIIKNISSEVPLINQLAGYIISSGGKRIRPLLTLASAKLCNYSGKRHIDLAASIEFIHTATLLHDDVVDESKKRRGQKSANLVWDNKSSILVGDFLLSKAFRLMIQDGSNKCLEILSKASIEISQGEVLQLQTNNNIKTTESQYLEIIGAKTAALFNAACTVSGVISEVNQEKQNALMDYGKFIGLSFQIVDDTLDYFSSNKVLGKDIGDDFKEGKVSLPIIIAYSRSNENEKKFWIRVINNKNQFKSDFTEAISIIKKYNVVEDCMKKAKHFSLMAKDSLSPFEDSYEKQNLLDLSNYIVNRVS